MGTNASDAKTLTDEIWCRDVKDMFTSAKMTEPYGFAAKYCFFMKFIQPNKELTNYYCFITDTGEVDCLSQVLPDIILTKKLEMTKVNYATKIFNDNYIAICGDENVSVITLIDGKLDEKKVNIPKPIFAFSVSSTSFAVLSESKIISVNQGTDGSLETTESFNFPENFAPNYENVLNFATQGVVVLSSATETYFGMLSNLTEFVKIDQIAGITKIVNYGSDFYFTKSDSPAALYHILFTGLSDKIKADVLDIPGYKKGIPIVDIEAISEKMCVILYEKFVYCTESNKIDQFPDYISGKKLFILPKKLFFLVIGKKGRIVIYKHPEITQQADTKETLKKADLSDLHKCEIQLICSPAEASFITFDEKNTIILWENLPNWWNAPNFLDMFGQNKAQNEATANAQ